MGHSAAFAALFLVVKQYLSGVSLQSLMAHLGTPLIAALLQLLPLLLPLLRGGGVQAVE